MARTLHGNPVLLARIDAHFLIKITLSEDVLVKEYFRQGSSGEMVKLPVKWMAPESPSEGHFSEKSDVVCVYTSCLAVGLLVSHDNLVGVIVVIWCNNVGDL